MWQEENNGVVGDLGAKGVLRINSAKTPGAEEWAKTGERVEWSCRDIPSGALYDARPG